ncbi:hypothetical protein F2Q69_00036065 [Brassica cretica]|uniref:ARM repeat N-terminal plant domain-containing protein n=2 Tax=Brassica cretica TaxID=69181 RepID=A0A8S9SQR3_BRACR|nr:hypothetical protein DY000_02040603 [Brassica cretica]KAF3603297.1 hypothetical protein F2Q69_00036065 [Brassica cretica]
MLKFDEPQCTNPSCFFCSMKEPNPFRRRSKLAAIFKEIPRTESKDHVLVLSGLWNIAMSEPDDPEFPSLGLFECMSKLIQKSIKNTAWLLKDQNIFIPYYAAHIIGSYAMNKEDLASLAVESKVSVVPALLELLRGRISWVEQRAAARALGHLASHEKSFGAVSVFEEEIVKLSMEIATTCLKNVYESFLGVEDSLRLKYQSDLLTRGLGGLETENQKAEEWGIQLQCWSLDLLNCFASRVNRKSPGGIGLIKTLCKTELGRSRVSEVREVIERLCDLSRSSDDWKEMALDTLLLLLKDSNVRVAQVVLQEYHKIKYSGLKMSSEEAQRSIENLWEVKVERKKKEKLMSETELEERRKMVKSLKKQGKKKFLMGFVEEAMEIYTVGIDLCPLDMIRDRVVLYSNRAQCCLLLKKAESAISDATRAFCLSGVDDPHGKSLWRRSQAYDLKGSARESLMDCLAFVDQRIQHSSTERVPYYAAQMIRKQMKDTWAFSGFDSKT